MDQCTLLYFAVLTVLRSAVPHLHKHMPSDPAAQMERLAPRLYHSMGCASAAVYVIADDLQASPP